MESASSDAGIVKGKKRVEKAVPKAKGKASKKAALKPVRKRGARPERE
jgi:hypothetical protein